MTPLLFPSHLPKELMMRYRTNIVLITTAAVALALAACSSAPAATRAAAPTTDSVAMAASTIKIVKIHYAQTGTNLNTEYIVIKNVSSRARFASSWKIVSSPDAQMYKFPNTKVGAGRTVTLYTGTGTNSRGKRYWGRTSPAWNNDGDTAVLKNAHGVVMDRCSYPGGGTSVTC